MDNREHAVDNEGTQAFLAGLKLRHGCSSSSSMPSVTPNADMFVWYFNDEKAPSVDELIEVGRDLAKHIEIETTNAVDAYSFKVGGACAIISGPFYVNALHDALRKRDGDCKVTLVVRHGFDDNRDARVFYSARCYDEAMSALRYLKEHIDDVGGNARAAGGSDGGKWLEQLKAQYARIEEVD